MVLLIDKTCKYCQQIEHLDAQYSGINKFYVENGIANINGEMVPLDQRISTLPVLIDGNHYFFYVDVILEHLKKSGEMNAKAN